MRAFAMMFTATAKEFVRDRTGLFWFFAFPVIFIFLFGLIFSSGEMGYSFDYILPGILSLALMQLGIFGAMQFLTLREKKIIRGLSLTPLSRSVLLSSEISVRLLAGFVQAGIIIVIGILVFDIHVLGKFYELILLVALGALTFISIGYMLICFVNSVEGGSGLAQVAQLPMMFLSGVFFPLELIPEFIRPIVRVIPLTYLADSLRQVMIGAKGAYPLHTNILFLLLFLVVTLFVTIRVWRWE